MGVGGWGGGGRGNGLSNHYSDPGIGSICFWFFASEVYGIATVDEICIIWLLSYVLNLLLMESKLLCLFCVCGVWTYAAACLFEFVNSCFCLFVLGLDICSRLFVFEFVNSCFCLFVLGFDVCSRLFVRVCR